MTLHYIDVHLEQHRFGERKLRREGAFTWGIICKEDDSVMIPCLGAAQHCVMPLESCQTGLRFRRRQRGL
jgi:hypothetical protein